MGSFKEVLVQYDAAVALIPNLERKGKTVPYTSSNGHMFSLLNKEGELGVRLGDKNKEAFIEEYKTGPLYSHGATMRGYARVPESMLDNPELLASYIQKAWDFVNSLPPK